MPEYLAPGVYIEEIERGPKPIEGVATSTAAFLGETERGPVKPRLVTSYNGYLRLFGNVFDHWRLCKLLNVSLTSKYMTVWVFVILFVGVSISSLSKLF